MKAVDSKRMKGIIMVIVSTSLWGISGTVAQQLFQKENISPEWLVTVRLLVAGMMLLIISLFTKKRNHLVKIWSHKKEGMKILIFGLVGMLGVQYTYFASINEGNAAVATLLQYLAPLFIFVYLIIKHRKLPSKTDSSAIILALLGTFLLLTNGSLATFTVSTKAIIWGILSGITLAFYTVYSKGLLDKWFSPVVTGWGMAIGGLGLTVLHYIDTKEFIFLTSLEGITMSSWLAIGFVVIFGTLIAFYLFLESIKYLSPKESSLIGCTEPLAAIVSSVIALHLSFGFYQWMGTICVIGMVFLLSQKSEEPQVERKENLLRR